MREQQREAATTSVVEWLSHPNELGKAPSEIECVGEFERHEMVYFIFRYQENPLGDWLLAVCGGYEGGSLEHCGHVFSEMQPYDPATAEENAIEMVESIRAYWMQQAKESEEQKGGAFISFVLLEECVWDREQTHASIRRGLIEETYELCDALLKDDEPNICKELGDVLWYISTLATELGLDLDEIATGNLAKLAARKEAGKIHGSGDLR